MPDDQCVLRVECRLGTEVANFTYFEVRSARLPEVESLSDGRVVLRKLAGETEVSSAWHEAEVERGVVDYEQHLMGGIESGHFDYRFTLPENCDLATAKSQR